MTLCSGSGSRQYRSSRPSRSRFFSPGVGRSRLQTSFGQKRLPCGAVATQLQSRRCGSHAAASGGGGPPSWTRRGPAWDSEPQQREVLKMHC
ncbi:Titin [Manis pentadactyla]|nr:Titin [Manis pentadactyla]